MLRKLGWFVLLYAGWLAVVGAVAFAIRAMIL